ncbi:uncharacterized protein LOC134276383 [Saccostrea cucullata]|uniref:uncharacterized protein LOC134276383 n=1 Tax=Saccostrea cuccullata TaxID=36930 RepID=UPI002ED19FE2
MASTSKFQAIKLTEDDVPGAKLIYPEVENHSVVQLRRWLLCRGVKTSGNKCDLVQRVKDCISSGNTDISVSVDAGKWMDLKASDLRASTSDDASNNPKIPPVVGWKVFPSTNLPQYFNEGHIHHYIIESVQLVDKPGNDSGEEDIDDLHTSKPLKKGKQYFKSGHVCNLKDFKSGNVYFLKASVMATYRINISYNVTVTMSTETGFVQDASCTYIASSMGRCSHVAAVLFALLDYCQQYGHEPAACTSKKCEWNVGRKKRKNPQKITESKYSGIKQKKIDELISYDPRPPIYQTDDNPDIEENTFWQELQFQNCSSSMWATLLKYNYADYDIDDLHAEELKIKRTVFLENLSLSLSTDPTEIFPAV